MSMRIAIAGFQHETNTFADMPTGLAEFEMADSWPDLLAAHDVIERTRGMNLPIAGFIEAAQVAHAEIVPILWCAAEPGGRVTDAAFETISQRILDGVRGAGAIDAIYLDLHGAMVTHTYDDGEGVLLSRLRALVGPDVLIVASLDMHANVTTEMVEKSDVLCIYRTYPHIDMAVTGLRAFRNLAHMHRGARPAKAFRQIPYLIPLHAQHTGAAPAKRLYDLLENKDGSGGVLGEIALGFTAADMVDTGPSVVVYAPTSDEAERTANHFYEAFLHAEAHFDCALLTPAESVSRAMENRSGRPVVIADVQDYPGAGASSDSTGVLVELIRQGARSALLGLLHDPQTARTAHQTGVGKEFDASLGGRAGFGEPVLARVEVETLSDGQCTYTGEMYGGGVATLGLSAVLRIVGTGVRVVVTSIRNQCLDQAQFTHFNLDLSEAQIICVKSTAHFRADFEPIAHEILIAAAPGGFSCELGTVPYRRLRSGVRLGPMGLEQSC